MKTISATAALLVGLCALGLLACSESDRTRLKARLGSDKAQFAIGQRAEAGTDGTLDYELAAEWYRKASAYPDAQFALAQLIARDQVEPTREGELESLLLAAAEEDHSLAQVALGELLLQSGPERETEALGWFDRAASAGSAEAQFHLGARSLRGSGADADPAEALRWLGLAAEKGHPAAQRLLGDVYAEGRGVTADPVQSTQWYRAAADQGDVSAQVALGRRYAEGAGVDRDPVEAAVWYLLAAEQGDAEAQSELGFAYWMGSGVPQSYPNAGEWLRAAADQGHAVAQNRLGVLYSNNLLASDENSQLPEWAQQALLRGMKVPDALLGKSVTEQNAESRKANYVEALKWFRASAEQGFAAAQLPLPMAYERGRGVDRDPLAALDWCTKAAEQGLDRAQMHLGEIYERGDDGIPKDLNKART
ncbi:MAG: sel1 repeat family protein, partial [Deltaproteobacteria bacterium]|nr:sel1 repeat family protein [Deltaproteobacteria bacterium]